MTKTDQKPTTTINESERDLRGTIQFVRSGNAFVELDAGSESLFVRQKDTGCALPGDSVSVRRLPNVGANSADGQLAEAQVVQVTKRGRTELTGVLRKARHGVVFEATDPRISTTIHIRDVAGAKANDRVVLRLDKHTTNKPQDTLQGRVVRTLGTQGDACTDHALVANEYRLPGRFPKPVRTEARDLAFELRDAVGRLDLRDRLVFTIDPEGSRDFDDALSVRRLNGGLWEVCVHIADVSHLVTPESALDREAFSRACSTYLPGQVTPMLPEELSNELCSLNPDQDRLAFTCILTLTDAGRVRDTRFVETRIRSRKRFTYEEAYEILKGNTSQTANTRVAKAVCQLGRLADMLRKRRFRDGALEIVTSEITPVLDPSGRLSDIRVTSSDAAHALVEEFMLATNEAACKTLQKAGFAQLFRSHPTPDPDRVAEAVRALNDAGVTQLDPGSAHSPAAVLAEIAKAPDAEVWATRLLQALPKASYSVDDAGHFGLAKQWYAHFTSPIRRYPDLVTHRLLKAAIKDEPQPLTRKELQRIAHHCSEREQRSVSAERHLTAMKFIRHLREQSEAGRHTPLAAIVTAVNHRGARAILPGYQIQGWIPAAAGQRPPRIGQRLKVSVAHADETRLRLDLRHTAAPQRARRNRRRR